MGKVRKIKPAVRVFFTRHFRERWRDHRCRGDPRRTMKWHLWHALQSGLRPDPYDGSYHVPLGGGRRAVCVLIENGWLAITVYRPGVFCQPPPAQGRGLAEADRKSRVD